jgi:soluble lytic murein transglycosylase-like protein
MASLSAQTLHVGWGIRAVAAAMALLAAVALVGPPRPVQAEPYLRIKKNGVIYYYFSNGDVGPPPASVRPLPRIRAHAPVPARRMSSQELDPLIQQVSRSHHVPPSLVRAVIRVESNFNPAATSPKGAQGLMQLMPGTAGDLQVVDPYDPRENVWGGVRYLRMLLERFHFQLPLALAAYNAGPQRVDRCQEVPPIPETQGFVRDVCQEFLKYSREQAATQKHQ